MFRFNATLISQSPQRKQQAVAWCHEHGVNVDHVPLDAKVDIIDDEHLEIEIYETTNQGLRMWDEANKCPKYRWLHVKYHRPLPDELLIEQ
jgi:hypothetical protein